MERKFLITSIFVTLGFITFLSGYLLMPEVDPSSQTGSLIERFNNDIDVKPSEDKVPKTLPLSSRKFLSFVNHFTDSKKIVAIDDKDNIVEIDLPTLIEKLYYTGQTNIVEAVLSPAGDSVIYSFYDAGNNKKYNYLNFRKDESAPIAGDLKSAAFSPRGDQTVYLISTHNGGELLVSKGGNIIKHALKTRLGTALVSWPGEFISIVSYDKDGYGDLFVLKESGELNKILSHQYDLAVKWSPSGEKVIFSTKDDYTGQTVINDGLTSIDVRLFYKDAKNSQPPVPLDISANALKCVWSDEEKIICAVKNQDKVRDEFYRVNLTDGTKTLVATPSINLLVKELVLNRSGDTLFVLNDIDSKIYSMKISN